MDSCGTTPQCCARKQCAPSAGIIDIWLRPGTITSEGHYWPLTWTTFWLNYRIHQEWTPGWHATNVMLHAGVAVMVGTTLQRIGVRGAWIAAALFAVHPIHAEVIGWTMARKDALAALLALAAVQRWCAEDKHRHTTAWPTVLLGAALLAKSSAIATIPAIVAVTWWQSGAMSRTQLARLSPLVGITLAIVTLDMIRYADVDPYELGYDLATRLGHAGWALGTQSVSLAWPTDLTPMRGAYRGERANQAGWTVLAGAAIATWALWLASARIGRAPAAALAVFICALAPTLGLIEFSFLRFSPSADRFAYIASIGPIALAGAGADGALRSAQRRWGATGRRAAMGVLGALLAVLAGLSSAQSTVYRDNLRFFTEVHARSPGNAGMTFNLAKALADSGALEQSVRLAREGAERHPHDARFPHHEGEGLRKLGRHAKARTAYARAIALEPERATTYLGLGYALLGEGRGTEAITALRQAGARSEMIAAGTAATIAKAQLQLGEVEGAIATYREGLVLRPDDPVLNANLASVLIATGRGAQARAHVERALRAAPGMTFAQELHGELENADGEQSRVCTTARSTELKNTE